MTERRPQALHDGELFVQRRMSSPTEIGENLPRYIDPNMSQQHADFYTGLSYLAVATMDKFGRPWATLLVAKSSDDPSVGIRVVGQDELEIVSLNATFDPFVRSLEQRKNLPSDEVVLFAGVGVDYSNRRRNKLAGTILSFNKASQETTQLRLKSDQHLGNCPKYITARQLQPFSRNPEVVLDRFDSFDGSLPDSCRALIERSSTIYLATRHVPETASGPYAEQDMGLNHRGGAPGFVRVYEEPSSTEVTGPGVSEDARTTYVVLPDYSGNRFYQSLGNVESDGLVGLTFPDFSTGDMLYLTGIAENLYEQEAEDLMPRVGLLTRVQITGVVYVRAAMQLRMTSNEAFSPYNPPVRYLRTEFADQRLVRESLTPSNQRIRACLVSTRKLSSSVRTFTFELLAPVAATLPGGFGIFDFSECFDSTYRHMDESNPQRVNDDYIRTWTISSAAGFSGKDKKLDTVQQIDITVKHKRGGAVSSFLHDKAAAPIEAAPLSVDFVGSGGGFSCFSQHTPDELPTVPPRMLWIAGGVGITPFMAMWDGILGLEKALAEDSRDLLADIVLMFAARDDDLSLLKHFLTRKSASTSGISLRILGFQSLGSNARQGREARDALIRAFPGADMVLAQQRVDRSDFAGIERLSERETFLCGPDAFMTHTQTLLESVVGNELNIRTESYSF